MDSAIIAALIGAVATIFAVLVNWLLQRRKKKIVSSSQQVPFQPDADDIYFMQFLLHDAYELGESISTSELTVHHSAYAPLELEVKLIALERNGYLQRTNQKHKGLGYWQMLPKGVEFMFTNNHQLHDLVEESRKND